MIKFLLGLLSGIVISALGMTILTRNAMKKFNSMEDTTPDLMNITPMGNASYNLKLLDLKTGAIFDTNLLKGKVLLFNFWERWCIPCREEIPSLERLFLTTRDSLVKFAIISNEHRSETSRDSMVSQSRLPFFHHEGIVPNVFDAEGLPRTYIVSRNGNIVLRQFGATEWDKEVVVDFIDSLKKLSIGN